MRFIIFLALFLIAAVPAQADELDGKELFGKRCNLCHTLDRPLSKTKTLGEWKTTTQRMVGKSKGRITSEEGEAIANYLAERE